jgi:hypothetical protein
MTGSYIRFTVGSAWGKRNFSLGELEDGSQFAICSAVSGRNRKGGRKGVSKNSDEKLVWGTPVRIATECVVNMGYPALDYVKYPCDPHNRKQA